MQLLGYSAIHSTLAMDVTPLSLLCYGWSPRSFTCESQVVTETWQNAQMWQESWLLLMPLPSPQLMPCKPH